MDISTLIEKIRLHQGKCADNDTNKLLDEILLFLCVDGNITICTEVITVICNDAYHKRDWLDFRKSIRPFMFCNKELNRICIQSIKYVQTNKGRKIGANFPALKSFYHATMVDGENVQHFINRHPNLEEIYLGSFFTFYNPCTGIECRRLRKLTIHLASPIWNEFIGNIPNLVYLDIKYCYTRDISNLKPHYGLRHLRSNYSSDELLDKFPNLKVFEDIGKSSERKKWNRDIDLLIVHAAYDIGDPNHHIHIKNLCVKGIGPTISPGTTIDNFITRDCTPIPSATNYIIDVPSNFKVHGDCVLVPTTKTDFNHMIVMMKRDDEIVGCNPRNKYTIRQKSKAYTQLTERMVDISIKILIIVEHTVNELKGKCYDSLHTYLMNCNYDV